MHPYRTMVDPVCMPDTGETCVERLRRATPIKGTPGQSYVERRGIHMETAEAADVRFDGDWCGRPAVLVALRDDRGAITSLHGRYLQTLRGQNKMLTVGRGGGVVSVGSGWIADPLIIVEGLFDALSLAECGHSCIATIGRLVPWLPQVTPDRTVWIAFDANQPGEHAAALLARALQPTSAMVRRLLPPQRCKDWNTALVRCGRHTVARWLRDAIHTKETSSA